MDRDRIVAERERLEQAREAAFVEALTAFDRLRTASLESGEAERQLREADYKLCAHKALYGTGDLTREPRGLLAIDTIEHANTPPRIAGARIESPPWLGLTRAVHEEIQLKARELGFVR